MIDIIAPTSAPQVFSPPLTGVQHPLAPEAMDAMLRHGNTPVSLWRVINGLAKARQPQGRDQRRCLCLRFWGAFRELLKAEKLFRRGSLISMVNISSQAKLPARTHNQRLHSTANPSRMPSVGSSNTQAGGSNPPADVPKTYHNFKQQPQRQVLTLSPGMNSDVAVSKSAGPNDSNVSAASRALARRPRMKKKWTGWLGGERLWRLKNVILPGGKLGEVYFVRRGWVYVLLPETAEFKDQLFQRYRAEEVQIYRSPEAVMLGRQKRGVRERWSALKTASARVNGLRPTRPGSNPRGRPQLNRKRPGAQSCKVSGCRCLA